MLVKFEKSPDFVIYFNYLHSVFLEPLYIFIRWCMALNLTLAFHIHEHFWSILLICLRKVNCLKKVRCWNWYWFCIVWNNNITIVNYVYNNIKWRLGVLVKCSPASKDKVDFWSNIVRCLSLKYFPMSLFDVDVIVNLSLFYIFSHEPLGQILFNFAQSIYNCWLYILLNSFFQIRNSLYNPNFIIIFLTYEM